MKNKILKIFSSNIKIKVTGININNFIKKLIKNKINISNVNELSYKEVELIINYKDLDKIEKLKTIYDIEIIKYYGKLKLLKILKKNIFIILFLIIGLITITVLSNIIFNIEIIHSNSKIVKLLETELQRHNIKKYSFVKDYKEIEKIENSILEDNKSTLEWLEIIREGTKYIVRVEERIINSKNEINKNYDIVASKNAVIKSIFAQRGEKIKDVNTYVKKGDVIISSNITLPNNEKIQSTSIGTVIGETWYTIETEYPYFYNETLYTGKKKKVLVFSFLNKRFALFDFDKYKTFKKNTKYIFKDNITPISLTYEYQYETNIINEIYTYEEAKEKAIELAKQKLLEKHKNIKSIDKVIIIFEEDNTSKINLTLFISCSEDITEYKEALVVHKENTIE